MEKITPSRRAHSPNSELSAGSDLGSCGNVSMLTEESPDEDDDDDRSAPRLAPPPPLKWKHGISCGAQNGVFGVSLHGCGIFFHRELLCGGCGLDDNPDAPAELETWDREDAPANLFEDE